jgi:serine/threonine-protein kinase HipA
MTLLGYADGANAASGVSYLELAEFSHATRIGIRCRPCRTLAAHRLQYLREQYGRSLENHGFMLAARGGWTLSPAYDMNPNPQGDGLTLNITENDNGRTWTWRWRLRGRFI